MPTVTGLDGWFSKYADPHTVNSFINEEAERYRWPADEHQGKNLSRWEARPSRPYPEPPQRTCAPKEAQVFHVQDCPGPRIKN